MPKIKRNQIVKTRKIADFFGMSEVDVNKYISNGDRLDYVYVVFNREDLTLTQKRDYLDGTSMSEQKKEGIWNRYQGDYFGRYAKGSSPSLEFRV